jgi:hypothetical protein
MTDLFKCACGREVPEDMTADISRLTPALRKQWRVLGNKTRCCDACYLNPTRHGHAHPGDFHTALGRAPAQVREIVAKAKARGHLNPDAPDVGPLVRAGTIRSLP